ncbi:glycosyltransferase [bacterium]|nr:glycosyltransferase [bacterium]
MRRSLKSLFYKLAPLGSKRYLIAEGIISFIRRKLSSRNIVYKKWIKKYDAVSYDWDQKNQDNFDQSPDTIKFSILMPVYNPPLGLLDEAIQSVRDQLYTNWELCIADDASSLQEVRSLIKKIAKEDSRINYILREQNGNISAASNSALEMATGDYVVLFDHDDRLHPQALNSAFQIINRKPAAEIIYSDRDKITAGGERYDPYFKPDFDYELLLCHNFVSHLDIYKLETVRKIGGFRLGLEGAQDYDLLLRVLEQIRPGQIHHIPRVLYHWRATSQSVAENINIKPYAIKAGERAINKHLVRKGIDGCVTYNPEFTAYEIEYSLPTPRPSVELIIMAQPDNIAPERINTLLDNTRYGKFTITMGVPGDVSSQALEEWAAKSQLSVVAVDSNISSLQALNELVSASEADFVGALDPDLGDFSPGWLEKLMGQAIQKGIGTVAPKLLDQRGRVYSNGIILGAGEIAAYLFKGRPADYLGYFGWGQLCRGYSAISGKCILFSRESFLAIDGIDTQYHVEDCAWIDFCLRLKQKGFRNVICPSVRLRFSTKQCGLIERKEIQSDKNRLLEKWGGYISHDPAFNQNLSLQRGKVFINLKRE